MYETHHEQQPEQGPRPGLHPRIWIGSLADYNSGRLHGDWVDAAVSDDELVTAAQRILASSREPGAEEWGIFDFDEFGDYRVGEYEDLAQVALVARGIATHGPAFAAWANLVSGDSERFQRFEEAWLGEFDSAEGWAEEFLADAGIEATLDRTVSASLRPFVKVDYAAFARDCQLGGELDVEAAPGGRVWIFLSDQ